MRDSTAVGSNNAGIHAIAGTASQNTIFDNVATFSNATGLVADGAQTRVYITHVAIFANNVGISRVNNGDVTSYLDNHINNNIAGNGTPSGTQTPQ